jgi:alpha-glucosidase (family GH31 glycosyl hydrolase)
VQLGVWSPILRLHSSDNIFNTREPWTYNAESQKIMTDALQFRHRLIPYLYTMAVLAATEGKLVVEPMYYEHSTKHEAYVHRNQFTFGTQLIVAPITSPRDRNTRLGRSTAWLPAGRYVDIFTGTVYDGDRSIVFHRTLDKTPVLAQEGAIVPTDAAEVLDGDCRVSTALEILVVVGADGAFEIIEDDSKGSNTKSIEFSKTKIEYSHSSGTLTISPASNALVENREWSVRLIAHTPSGEVSVNGKTVPSKKVANGTLVKLGSFPTTETITVQLAANGQLDKNTVKSTIFGIIDSAQVAYNTKKDLWNVIQEDLGLNVRLSRLGALGLDRALLEAVLEHLLADSRV